MILVARKNERRVAFLLAVTALLTGVVALGFRTSLGWAVEVPASLHLPIAHTLNIVFDVMKATFQGLLRTISDGLEWVLLLVRSGLNVLPWPVFVLAVGLLVWRIAGRRLAFFAAGIFIYVLLVGFWPQTLDTITLVCIGLPLACVLGAALGVLAHLNRNVAAAIDFLLDLMQTVPAFAYLTPLVVLFGFGPVAGLVASVLYALPPMARNVRLGLDTAPESNLEAAAMAGCTPLQTFFWVRVGTARRQILMGLNQTIMSTLAMVIFAAIIGGFEDIGWEVLRAARKAEFGIGILTGLIITLLAILFDRVSEAGFRRQPGEVGRKPDLWLYVGGSMLALAATWVLLAPLLPAAEELSARNLLAARLDQMFDAVNAALSPLLTAVKTFLVTYLLLPLRMGMVKVMVPNVWGVTLTPAMTLFYMAALVGGAAYLMWRGRVTGALLLLATGLLLYTGFLGMPWLSLGLLIVAAGIRVGGLALGLGTVLGVAFIAVSGLWASTMFSAYLLAGAILTAMVVGGLLGAAAAGSLWVSRTIRPINDFFQTIPPFVILIPLIMFFQIGDFSSFVAIALVSTVPMIRYTEQGLRNVPQTLNEVGKLSGCTRLQALLWIKLPAARAELLLGLNQTVMMSLVMLSIAALVGSRGLGQDVYSALSKADPGLGLQSGLAIAVIALLTDRILRRLASQV